jgi:hypothetical protein
LAQPRPTPVARVRGRSRRRLSVAALICYKPGRPARLIYRPRADTRPDGRKSFGWTDYRDLLQAAHQQLGGLIVPVRVYQIGATSLGVRPL